jgi:hypothetical protein
VRILINSSLCPNCASKAIHRSKRKGLLERILYTALFISPYRCDACDERFFWFRPPVHRTETPPRHVA